MRLFVPADAPAWLTAFARSIEDKFRSLLTAPLRLMGLAAAELPDPADYRQGLVFDTDTGEIAYSTGSDWRRLFGSGNPALGAIAALTPAADRYVYYTGPDSAALGTITPFGRGLLDDADAAALRLTIGAAADPHGHAIADVSGLQAALDAKLDDSQASAFGLTLLDDSNAAAARATLGAEADIAAGTSAQYWRGDKSWQGLAASAVANSPAGSIAATNVQAAIDELDGEKQPLDSELTALAGLASAADKLPYFTGSGTAALADFTAAGRSMAAAASAAAQRELLRSGCKVTKTTGLTGLNFSAGLNISWDNEVWDDNGWHDTGSNSERMTVPSGITRVEGIACIRLANVTASLTATLTITRNGVGTVAMMHGTTSSTGPAITVAFADSCAAGDYYMVNMFVNDANADLNTNGSFFFVRAA